MSCDLKGKIVLITGGALGIGALATKLFLEEGAKHVAVSDVDENAGKKLEQELNAAYPGRISFTKCDVTNEDELTSHFDKVIKEQGYIDVLINNAGLMNDSPNVYKKTIEVNVTALVTSTLKARDIMRKDRNGRGGIIVNTASVVALMQDSLFPVYSGTKSAVLQFSNCIGLKRSYEKTGVKVIAICYGATATSLLSKEKLICYDEDDTAILSNVIQSYPVQSTESAAKGLVEACKRGDSGSTWLSRNDLPVVDITAEINKVYTTLTELVFKTAG